jgi:glycolate oxidase FAD binding subunit
MDAATNPVLTRLIERTKHASQTGIALEIRGGGSKAFYGEAANGEPFDVRELRGISSYEPTELVVTARAGTPLVELETALAEHGQCLPFEPPHFATRGPSVATVGGMVAAGLAGPARASAGSVRDFVLGATLLNGRGEVLTFGGQVMKNVAGYDVSRLLVGSMGILGVICEVSLKVLPAAAATRTACFELDERDMLYRVNSWAAMPLPLNATAWYEGRLFVRFKGASAAVDAAVARLGGQPIDTAQAELFWSGLRDHRHEFFSSVTSALGDGKTLWRLSVPPTADPLQLPGKQLIDWGGAQRWWHTNAPPSDVRDVAARARGHATLFYARDKSAGVFTPLESGLDRIHRELKKAFDPARIFNRGRLYPDL